MALEGAYPDSGPEKIIPLPNGACFWAQDVVPEGAPPMEDGETVFAWSQRTGILPLIGPGDLKEIIEEPDYEESLRKSARIFGGTPEDYRNPDMDQSTWEMIGSQHRIPEDLTGDYDAIPLPPARVASKRTQGVLDATFDGFFRKLDTMPVCCVETLGTVTEALAVLERGLIEKSLEALDVAYGIAKSRSDTAELRLVSQAYRDAAKELS